MSDLKWYAVYSGTNALVAEVQAVSKGAAEEAVQGKGYCYQGHPWAMKLPCFSMDDEMCNRIVDELMWYSPLNERAINGLFVYTHGSVTRYPNPAEIYTRLCALVREGVLRVVFTPCESWEVVK